MVSSSIDAITSVFWTNPREDWLALHREDILDPGQPIVDPHHHLWDRVGQRYMLDEVTEDITSGHNVVATVYVDCRSMYRAGGPESMQPVGEAGIGGRSHSELRCRNLSQQRCKTDARAAAFGATSGGAARLRSVGVMPADTTPLKVSFVVSAPGRSS